MPTPTAGTRSRSFKAPSRSVTKVGDTPLIGDFFARVKEAANVNDAAKCTDADCHIVLTKVFGYTEYKGKQKEIFKAAVQGQDVFVLAPTGMGKSICFQVPALAEKRGITLVISPLLSLMKNQVAALLRKHILVASFTSETPAKQKKEITQDLSSGHPRHRLLYVTPEKLATGDFSSLMKKVYANGELNRLVVDEAHCISEWGHDFRSAYRQLGTFRANFPDVPIMALTASATANVQEDIIKSLGMLENNLYKAVHPFNRANLFYEVQYVSGLSSDIQINAVYEYINKLHRRRGRPSSGIVYCRTKATCDELTSYLRGKGLNAKAYHRGIPPKTLDKTLGDWLRGGDGNGGVDVVCATIAFGMGIDKSDVRYIIHYDLPKSLEGYYQETGRAGRDGEPSKCVLFYSREDAMTVRRWISTSHDRRISAADSWGGPPPSQRAGDSLQALINLAESVDICRHISICRYFGEEINEKDAHAVQQYCDNMCDVCKYPDKVRKRKEDLSPYDYASTQAQQYDTSIMDEDIDDEPSEDVFGLGPERFNRGLDRAGSRGPITLGNEGAGAPPKLEARFTSAGAALAQTRTLPLKRPGSGILGSSKRTKTTDATTALGMGVGLSAALKKPFKPPSLKAPLRDVPQNTTLHPSPLSVSTVQTEDDADVVDDRTISPPAITSASRLEIQETDLVAAPELAVYEDENELANTGFVTDMRPFFSDDLNDNGTEAVDAATTPELQDQEVRYSSPWDIESNELDEAVLAKDEVLEAEEPGPSPDWEFVDEVAMPVPPTTEANVSRPKSVLERILDKPSSKLSPIVLHRAQSPEVIDLSEELDDQVPNTAFPSSPVAVPVEEVELEGLFSQKIKLSLRKNAAKSLRDALQQSFMKTSRKREMWERSGLKATDNQSRMDLLSNLTRDLEWSIHSMSRSDDGYTSRLDAKLDAIRNLTSEEAWAADGTDEMEESREVANMVKRMAGKRRTAGRR